MSDKTKKVALGLSGLALTIAMGIQTFVLGKNDLDAIKQDLASLTTRIDRVELRLAK